MNQNFYHTFEQHFKKQFLKSVSLFFLYFGGFWVVFTAGLMIVMEGKQYLANPEFGITSVLSLFYLARVFWSFRHDVNQAADDPTFVFIPSLKKFFIDLMIYAILISYQVYLMISSPEVSTIYGFNTLTNVFFVFQLSFFRFIYHFLFTPSVTKKSD